MSPINVSSDTLLDPIMASLTRRAWQRFRRHRAGMVGLAIIATLTLLSLVAPVVAPYPDDAGDTSHVERRFQPPSAEHIFGTDQLGRDILSRILFGGRVSLTIAFLAVVGSAAIGALLGLIAGYREGWVDELIMRFADMFLGIPSLVLAMLVVLALGGGSMMTVIAIALTWWPYYGRLVRGEVLRVKPQEYVEAARAYGSGTGRLLMRHIFPATLPVITVQLTLQMGQAILVTAALSFIGLGAKPPSPEWGLVVAVGREYLPDIWWISFFSGMAIFVTVVAFNLLGDAVRVALDPRAEQRI